jgi:ABC-type uncharacterized transport system permease subunit
MISGLAREWVVLARRSLATRLVMVVVAVVVAVAVAVAVLMAVSVSPAVVVDEE